MAHLNNYLLTVFTSQTGEAFTVLQLLHQIAEQISAGAGEDLSELAKVVSQIETTVADHTQKLADLTARLQQAETDIDALQQAIAGVETTLDTLNGEVV